MADDSKQRSIKYLDLSEYAAHANLTKVGDYTTHIDAIKEDMDKPVKIQCSYSLQVSVSCANPCYIEMGRMSWEHQENPANPCSSSISIPANSPEEVKQWLTDHLDDEIAKCIAIRNARCEKRLNEIKQRLETLREARRNKKRRGN